MDITREIYFNGADKLCGEHCKKVWTDSNIDDVHI